MSLKPSPTPISRTGGCTLTGALSVTTQVRHAASIIHGPKGCTHHNFSLFHATLLENGQALLPDLVSSGLAESDIVFGGEEALARTLDAVCGRDVDAVFVLSTCVVATIGDDVEAVCGRDWPVPVIPVPTAGFLGGTFQDGVNNALIALADRAGSGPVASPQGVSIIGEKNLEYEVEENFAEVSRLLSLLGLRAGIRFVRNLPVDEMGDLAGARLNILRDPALRPVGEHLRHRFGTPYIDSFPGGLSDTLTFLRSVAAACGIDPARAIADEEAFQARVLADFADIGEATGSFRGPALDDGCSLAAREAATALRIRVTGSEGACHLPVAPVVGTSGVRRMLHRWRRAIHA